MIEQSSSSDPIRHFSSQQAISTGQSTIVTRCQHITTAVPKPVSKELKVTGGECEKTTAMVNITRSTHALADMSPYPRLLCQCRILVMHDPCDGTPFTVPLHAVGCPNRLENLLNQGTGSTVWVSGCSKPAIRRVHRRTIVRKRHERRSAQQPEKKKSLE
ncbi:hypothetical protein LZ32DRAFT_600895 [Colletotrichum eremochloae]|nr:hypothetical protein LZ32DRAFT_600895 [Colletotrichum eremochloae]